MLLAFGSESDPNSNCSSLAWSTSSPNSSYLRRRDKHISPTCHRREDSCSQWVGDAYKMKSTKVQNPRRIATAYLAYYANARAQKLGTPRVFVASPCAPPRGRVRSETIRTRTIYNEWVGSRNVVLEDAGFSIPNGVFLAKSPHTFSSACCARAVGITHESI